ncbi:hypothetical protein BRARA_D00197 [Brassica rapa]|uniref:Mitochondrial proton/calcium exchanger protein n=1 Tax=Brassica campestris TaxID=3711 RepID=A0A397ZHS2_BRACM|nr:hypothetical protein BRARA_D00197 [Brassica rapa]
MASRAILRRKSIVSDYLNVYARSAQSFQSSGNSAQKVNNPPLVAKDKSFTGGYGLLLLSRFHGSSHVSGIGFGSLEMGSSLGMRYMSVSIHNATKKPEEEEKRKEASPEECDQAVESLSSVKAKAKAKRLQDSKKVARSILQRTWVFILGIGPALRAVASMSRADWGKKLTHWKQEFVSTLKHYWLGTKLLWADTRISSRLLLKLAGGKSLSRRERQQLTRTTADIFRLVPFAVFILDVKGGEEDKALQEMTIPTAREAQEQARARVLEQQDDLCKLSRALGVLASASSVCREREEFLRLVKKEVEFYNTMVEREDVDGEKAAMKAYKAAREDSDQSDEVAEADEVSSALMEKVDGLIQNLEKEIDDVDIKIGKGWLLLDRDRDGKVTPDEVAAAAMYLKDTLANEGLQQLISNLSKDKEGRIMVEDIVRLGRLGSKPEENATEEEESN